VWIRNFYIPDSLIPGITFFESCVVIGAGASLLVVALWIISEPILFEINRRRNLEPLHLKITTMGFYWGDFISVANSCCNTRRWEGIVFVIFFPVLLVCVFSRFFQ
jgi:hypothetical protein